MKNSYDQIRMTSDLWMTRNESEIIDLLVDHHEMPANFTEDQVISFFCNNDYHLIFYFSKQGDKGFQMYVVRDFSVHDEELYMLYHLFKNLANGGLNTHLFTKACSKVDHLIRMAKTFRVLIHNDLSDNQEE